MSVRHWAQIGENTFVAGIWLLYWIHRLLGRWPFRLALYPVIAAYWLARGDVRAASLQYLARLQAATGALGHAPTWRDGLRHVGLFAETLLDKLLAVSGRYRFANVQTEGREEIYAIAGRGVGGLLVTAHLGCLEIGRAMAGHRGVFRLNILVHTRHAAQFNRLLKRLNPDQDVNLIEVTAIGPETALLLGEKVAAGEYVVIAGDRVPVFASQTVQVDFLGHPAPLPAGPWVLAALLKCPVHLLACIHEHGSYTIRFEPLADRVELPRGRRGEAIADYASRYVAALTGMLKRSPYDWFNFFPFWDQTNGSDRT